MRRRAPATRSADSSSSESTACRSASAAIGNRPFGSTESWRAPSMGMQTVKAVEIGLGAGVAATPGSQAHDVFALDGESVVRASNRAGGIEGGMSNGEPIVVRVSVKPIPTLMKALPSVNLHQGTDAPATIVRSDVCVVPAACDRRRSDGAARADGTRAREIRRRLDGRDAGQPASEPRGRRASLCARAMKRHVALVGFMASGKSTLGRQLARRLACAFVDTDASDRAIPRRDCNDLRARRRGRVPALRACRDRPRARKRRGMRDRAGRRGIDRRRQPRTPGRERSPHLPARSAGAGVGAAAAQPGAPPGAGRHSDARSDRRSVRAPHAPVRGRRLHRRGRTLEWARGR